MTNKTELLKELDGLLSCCERQRFDPLKLRRNDLPLEYYAAWIEEYFSDNICILNETYGKNYGGIKTNTILGHKIIVPANLGLYARQLSPKPGKSTLGGVREASWWKDETSADIHALIDFLKRFNAAVEDAFNDETVLKSWQEYCEYRVISALDCALDCRKQFKVMRLEYKKAARFPNLRIAAKDRFAALRSEHKKYINEAIAFKKELKR